MFGKSILVKIDVEGLELDVLAGARRVMDQASVYGLVLEVLHLSDEDISRLFDLGHVYMLDLATGGLVEIRDENFLRAMSGRGNLAIHSQDIFVLSRKPAES